MESVMYVSTRSQSQPVAASTAILQGLAGDGGLFVPQRIPSLDHSLEELSRMDYREVAFQVMKLFFTDYSEEELGDCIGRAYDEKFDTEAIAPLAQVGDTYYLELYHGPTIAFKDMALSILPHLMTTAARKHGLSEEIVILAATSGDTGKAAMAGFADVPGTKIIVFYPKDGVSDIQERQMVTQKGDNTCVIGIHGNFDDAQTGVKKMFADQALAEKLLRNGYRLSSANSINIGRLMPQIVYYVYAYTRLLGEGRISAGEKINVTVPTGNFGNILAAYYAKRMGLPIGKLLCASNENKVLFDFLTTGIYDKNREFVVTSSPSMDILVSSNLERLLYHLAGEDPSVTAGLMEELRLTGRYRITEQMKERMEEFYGNYADQTQTLHSIRKVYGQYGYLIDPHTAVAAAVNEKYRAETGDRTPSLIVSTASPFKFTGTVMEAIAPDCGQEDAFALADRISAMTGIPVPGAVEEARRLPIRHTTVGEVAEMPALAMQFLGI